MRNLFTGFQGNSSNTEKVNDIKMAVSIACHTSTRYIDHLGEMVRDLGKGSPLEHMRMHRTKCSKVIERVVAPSLLQEIVEDLGDRFYSMIVDGGTDIGTSKQLGLCIRFYSLKHKKMLTYTLGLIESATQTADKLYEIFVAFMTSLGFRLNRLLALGTDGGPNFCGSNHSLYALLKKDIPHLMIVRCVCHSLDKCASYASQAFPPTLEFMIREARNWFSHSSNRKMKYAETFQVQFRPRNNLSLQNGWSDCVLISFFFHFVSGAVRDGPAASGEASCYSMVVFLRRRQNPFATIPGPEEAL